MENEVNSLSDRPLFTRAYEDVALFAPERGSNYILGFSVEERSGHSMQWEHAVDDVSFVRITDEQEVGFSCLVDGRNRDFRLRSSIQLREFWAAIKGGATYLDITGLSHHVWAPLLKAGLEIGGREIIVTYVEPGDYRFNAMPTEGEIFDLSEKIRGISSLPGFANLLDEEGDRACFVPLLGFEGIRLAYLLEQVQPAGGKIVPVVGVPGFRPEYPFYTFHGNRSVLSETQAWKNVRFAIANCPFSLFYALQDIAGDYGDDLLKIAPIGTKPHALGAILFAISNGRKVEIVYDHPIRKASRTGGTARLLAYSVSAFMEV